MKRKSAVSNFKEALQEEEKLLTQTGFPTFRELVDSSVATIKSAKEARKPIPKETWIPSSNANNLTRTIKGEKQFFFVADQYKDDYKRLRETMSYKPPLAPVQEVDESLHEPHAAIQEQRIPNNAPHSPSIFQQAWRALSSCIFKQ